MQTCTKVLDRIFSVLAGIAAAVLLFMLLAVCFATLSRYIANKPFAPLVDFTAYALVWVAFLAAPWLMRIRRHVVIDLFISRAKPRVQTGWRMGTYIAMVFVALVMTFVSTWLTIDYIALGRVMTDYTRTPQWIVLIPIPVGTFFLAWASVLNAIEEFKKLRGSADGSGGADEGPSLEGAESTAAGPPPAVDESEEGPA
jgi:C4-dicarboxylate transporter DctQ subunit